MNYKSGTYPMRSLLMSLVMVLDDTSLLAQSDRIHGWMALPWYCTPHMIDVNKRVMVITNWVIMYEENRLQ